MNSSSIVKHHIRIVNDRAGLGPRSMVPVSRSEPKFRVGVRQRINRTGPLPREGSDDPRSLQCGVTAKISFARDTPIITLTQDFATLFTPNFPRHARICSHLHPSSPLLLTLTLLPPLFPLRPSHLPILLANPPLIAIASANDELVLFAMRPSGPLTFPRTEHRHYPLHLLGAPRIVGGIRSRL